MQQNFVRKSSQKNFELDCTFLLQVSITTVYWTSQIQLKSWQLDITNNHDHKLQPAVGWKQSKKIGEWNWRMEKDVQEYWKTQSNCRIQPGEGLFFALSAMLNFGQLCAHNDCRWLYEIVRHVLYSILFFKVFSSISFNSSPFEI